MALEMRQELRLSQQLVMTPQLQQAIRLLQLSRGELADMLQDELLENPILADDYEDETTRMDNPDGSAEGSLEHFERAGQTETPLGAEGDAIREVKADGTGTNEVDWESYLDDYQSGPSQGGGIRMDSEDMPSVEATLTKPASLYDHLAWQLRMSGLSDKEMEFGIAIIGNIDGDGYFKEPPLEELAGEHEIDLDTAEKVLQTLQGFEPVGVAARSLKECLLIQAMHCQQDDEIVVKMIKSHLENLQRKNYPAIAKDLKQPLDEIYEAAKVIMEFHPRPGREYSTDDAQYISPDVHIHKVANKYFVVPNDDGLPKLKISGFYKNALGQETGAGSKEYVQDRLRAAQWLIRSIQQRQRTIIRVAESILKFQRDFFEYGVSHLKPLILRDVAEDIGMHESTVSRVTTNKYVHTPQGIFELKFFFSSGIAKTNGEDMAAAAVKNKLTELIDSEDPKKPHSDQKLVELLKKAGIDIARRTVAKYREQLGKASSSQRKRVF